MMSLTLRIFLIVCSVLASLYTMIKIRKAQLNIDDSLYWIVLSVILLIMSLFPGLVQWAANLFGFIGTVNFVFFFLIFMIIVKLFGIAIDLSIAKHRLNLLIQKTALKNKEEDDKVNDILSESLPDEENPDNKEITHN